MNASSEVNINSKIYLDYRIWSIPAIFLRDILIGYYIGVQKIKAATFKHFKYKAWEFGNAFQIMKMGGTHMSTTKLNVQLSHSKNECV